MHFTNTQEHERSLNRVYNNILLTLRIKYVGTVVNEHVQINFLQHYNHDRP